MLVSDQRRGGYLLAGTAAFLFGLSPILTRWATETLSAAEITFGRLILAGPGVLALALHRGETIPFRSAPRLYFFLGLVLSLHLLTFVAAFFFTTLAHVVTLIYASVIFAALMSQFWLKEYLSARQWAGIAVALGGLALLTGFEPAMNRRMLWGHLLALVSALTYALYSVAGRQLRQRSPLFAYSGVVYLVAAACTLPAAIATFSPTGYTWKSVASVMASGLLPMATGHTLYNAALRRLNAAVVNLMAMQEVVIAVLAGMLLFAEQPTASTLSGVGIALAGLIMVAL